MFNKLMGKMKKENRVLGQIVQRGGGHGRRSVLMDGDEQCNEDRRI